MNEKVRGGKRMLSFGDEPGLGGITETKRLVRELPPHLSQIKAVMDDRELQTAVPAEGSGQDAGGEHET